MSFFGRNLKLPIVMDWRQLLRFIMRFGIRKFSTAFARKDRYSKSIVMITTAMLQIASDFDDKFDLANSHRFLQALGLPLLQEVVELSRVRSRIGFVFVSRSDSSLFCSLCREER